MAHACPNALSLAVAVAISSSIIGTQALADRKLQTKSADILGNKHAEFTQSEVMVRPTSGPDQQPIPKSITTTYPYEPLVSVDYVIPSLSFTEVLYGIDGGVSSVDQFETDENDVAQMYTKVLKVGDEGVFRFTHNLEEKELIIEVRGKMTDQDSIDAVRDHLHQSLEPLTKIASPEQLADLLKAANSRAGNLGKHDHYVTLAIIEVEKVEVRGRTFMRLIASGDQPPDLQSLGQSLFVNDEALLAAATSAYIRVHALGEDLQQQALNELLAHSKPVGYVVLAEDNTRVYPVPVGYPKLEVAETPGEVIVFHGQKLNPNDAAFVENLYKLREEAKANNPAHSVTTQVKNYKVESYQYVIRSSQMALLEEFAARHGAEANEGQITLEYEDKVAAFALANYESLLQALSSATPDRAGEFELTPEQIRAASTVITPTWMQSQLLKHFSFKPALRDLLTNPHSVQKILKHIPIVAKSVTNILYKNKKFAFHFLDNMVRKLTEVDSELEELLQAVELHQLEYKQQHESDPADASDEIKLIAQGIHRMIKDKLAQILVKLNDQRSLQQSLIQEIERIPLLRQQVPDARKKARSVYNSGLAIQLGIDDWDDAQPLERQARRLLEKIDDKCSEVLKTRYHSTEQADDGAVKAKLAAIEGQLGITPINENDLDDRYRSIQQHLIYKTEQIIGDDPFILIIKQRPGGGLVPFDEADRQALDQVHKQQSALTEAEKAAEIKARFAVIAEHLHIQNFRGDADIDTQLALLLEKIKSMKSHQPRLMNLSTRQNDPLEKDRTKNIQTEQMKFQHLLNRPVQNRYGEADIKRLQGAVTDTFGIELENPGTKGQIARPEILEKLDAVEKALIPAIKHSLFDDVRSRYNEIAHQLGIEDYKYAAPDIVKIHLIKEGLKKLSVKLFALGDPDVNERIATINAELNWQMARLGSKPRYVLDREVARAKGDIEEAETELEELHRQLDAIHRKKVAFTHSTDVHPDTDKDITVLNQAMKHTQTGSSLTQGDDQTPKDQLDGIERFIKKSEDGSGRRVEIVQKLIATIRNLKIPFDNDPDNLSEEDYINAIVDYAASYGRDKADEADYLGKLPETRRQYTQITEFLHEHDFRKMELAYAQDGEKQAQEELDTKNRAIDHSRNIDPETKTKLKDERDAQALILEWRKAVVSEAQANLEVHGASLRVIEDDVGLKPEPTARLAERVDALRDKQVQLGGLDGTGGMIQQLTEEQDSLNREIEIRKARIVILKGVLESAEEAIENEGVSFQYTPGQAKILTEIHTYMGEHSFRKQALEAAMGLAKSAELSSKSIPNLQTFDLDDEFAPIRLQALVGDHMTFDRARRTVEIFKNLKTTFTIRPTEDQSLNPLGEAQKLADRARSHIKTGPQHYDDEIHSMGEAAIHFIEHEPRDLKSFSEYFAAHSASGNRIIALLSESLISKVELENYMEAIRGVDEYQTVAEFEHFLGYKHGVKVPEFQKVVRMLSDRGTKEFMHSAFTPVTATGTTGMKESVTGMKVYAAAVITNYVLDDIAFENGRKTAAFMAKVQDTLTPYAHATGMSESDLFKAIDSTLMLAHAVAAELQLNDYWIKPSAFMLQALTGYYSSYKPLMVTHTAPEAVRLFLSNMQLLYLLDLTNRGDYMHRMLIPFEHWMERYRVDLDRTRQYAYHSRIEEISEVGALAMPLGKAASSVILMKTGSALFTRQYNANSHRYRTIYRLVPEMVKSMGSGQGIQIPLVHRITPEKVKILASATVGIVLGPVATAGAYAHGLLSGFTYVQTFGLALATSLTFDFFMNDNKILTDWLGGPLGRSLDKLNRWRGLGETKTDYVKRTAIAKPQRYNETDEKYACRVKVKNVMYGWMRNENYLQFRERRDRTMKMYSNGWEKYFKKNVPKWSFSHAESIPYSYTLGALYKWHQNIDRKARRTSAPASSTAVKAAMAGHEIERFDPDKDKKIHGEL